MLASSDERLLRHQVAEQDAVDAPQGHGDPGDDQRVADRLESVSKDHPIVLQREGVVRAERDDDRGVEQQCVEVDDGQGDERAGEQKRVARGERDADERCLAGALAGDGHVIATAYPVTLQQKDDERGNEQYERQRGPAAQVEQPRDLQERLCGQYGEAIAGENQRLWRNRRATRRTTTGRRWRTPGSSAAASRCGRRASASHRVRAPCLRCSSRSRRGSAAA